MRHTTLILLLLLCGCGRLRVEPDTRPSFIIDASKPFVIELGRGSGLHGLDVVKIDQTGSAHLQRLAGGASIEAASLQLSGPDVKKLVDLVNSCQLTGMGRSYSDPNVADGTQWVLWIQQASSEKSTYFNNAFPNQITAFARGLDALLQGAGLNAVSWTPIPQQQATKEQAAVWAHIEPAR